MRASKPRFQRKYISIFAPKINIISASNTYLKNHREHGTCKWNIYLFYWHYSNTVSRSRSHVGKLRSVFCLLYKFTKSDGVEGIAFHLHPKKTTKENYISRSSFPNIHFWQDIFL